VILDATGDPGALVEVFDQIAAGQLSAKAIADERDEPSAVGAGDQAAVNRNTP
jgi:hypothetical protein